VPLQRSGLHVQAAGEHHVAVEAADLLGAEVEIELGRVDPLPLRGEQLDEIGAAVGLTGAEDLREVGTERGHGTHS